jgi:predicted nucleic acid-binding protein
MNSTNIIIDASIIIKWLLPDEEDKIALKIKQDFDKEMLTITIPHLTYYEIGNVLKTAIKRERISEDSAKKLYSALIDLEFVVYATKDLFALTLSKSIDFDISVYDASYVALAEYLQKPFVTADRKLLNKVKNKFVIDLREYKV